MTLYQVQGTITRTVTEYSSARQIPTFYLDSRVQGILSVEHAREVASDIVATILGGGAPGVAVEWSLVVTKAVTEGERA